MKYAIAFIVGIFLVGCDQANTPSQIYHRNARVNIEAPPLWIPPELRQKNYVRGGEGSCSHVGTHNVLIQCGLWRIVADWRRTAGGGDLITATEAAAHRYGLTTAKTTSGDVRFLLKCHMARIPAMIYYYRAHAVTFVRFSADFKYVVLIEVNGRRPEIQIPVDRFIANWNSYGRGYGFDGGVALSLSPIEHPPRPAFPPCATLF
ncbi:MAG TPA: hypothetical protein VM487_19920 [Phycisphaerae bacterium]|nr:hypothetical protein [Phycisphaerae bacterium]